MFDFLQDADNYDERKVGRFEDERRRTFVSTAEVSDGFKAYETAVAHPEFNDGAMVIVEAYETKAAAKLGHKRWQRKVEGDKLPDPLIDIANCPLGAMQTIGGRTHARQRPN